MGFTEVLAQLPRIIGLLRTVRAELARTRPDVVVVIDAPDFHFRVARIAKSLGIPVVYYISPKLWAWREGRVEFLRRHVDRLVSILPFEVDFYARHGMSIDYVGHPCSTPSAPRKFWTRPKTPGASASPGGRRARSRPCCPFSPAPHLLLAAHFPGPGIHPARGPRHGPEAHRRLLDLDASGHSGDSAGRYELMRSCRAIMAASGTATLETSPAGRADGSGLQVLPADVPAGQTPGQSAVHVPAQPHPG